MHDLKPTERIVQVLLELANHRFGKTQLELAEKYNISERQVRRYFSVFRSIGFVVASDDKGRFRLEQENREYRELQELLHFSEEDNLLLSRAIDSITTNTRRREQLKRKLLAVYDFERLGYSYLTQKTLNHLQLLRQACSDEHQIILTQYRSTNSMERRDRLVEVFHLDPAEDKVFAFDVEAGANKMFKFSRMNAVLVTSTKWAYTTQHRMLPLDPFRIHDEEQVEIALRLNLAAYNYLQDYFPMAANQAKEDGDTHYQLHCLVNAKFLGITNFILANAGHVQVLSPEPLRQHLNETIKNLTF